MRNIQRKFIFIPSILLTGFVAASSFASTAEARPNRGGRDRVARNDVAVERRQAQRRELQRRERRLDRREAKLDRRVAQQRFRRGRRQPIPYWKKAKLQRIRARRMAELRRLRRAQAYGYYYY